MAKVLADWLKEEYKVVGRNIVSKKPFEAIINNVKVEIPKEAVWIQTFGQKNNSDLIVSCIPTLTHAYCLTLAETYKDIVKLGTAKRTVQRWPHDNSSLHGYVEIINEDGVWADGEVHKSTINESMYAYINTMMMKRAEDRLVLRALGLYSQGFYSKEEFGGNDTHVDIEELANKSTNEINIPKKGTEKVSTQSSGPIPEDAKSKARKDDIKAMLIKIQEKEAGFDLKTFATNLLNVAPNEKWTNYGDEDYKKIYSALYSKLADMGLSL